LKNLTPEGGKVLKKSSGKGPYVLRTDKGQRLRARMQCVANRMQGRDAGGDPEAYTIAVRFAPASNPAHELADTTAGRSPGGVFDPACGFFSVRATA